MMKPAVVIDGLGFHTFFWVKPDVIHLFPALYQRAAASYRKTSFN